MTETVDAQITRWTAWVRDAVAETFQKQAVGVPRAYITFHLGEERRHLVYRTYIGRGSTPTEAAVQAVAKFFTGQSRGDSVTPGQEIPLLPVEKRIVLWWRRLPELAYRRDFETDSGEFIASFRCVAADFDAQLIIEEDVA